MRFPPSQAELPPDAPDQVSAQVSSQGLPHALPGARRLASSLTLKLIALIAVFIALPIVLYGQFESADRQRRELVTKGIQQRSWMIAQALTPLLNRPEGVQHNGLNAELNKYNDGRTLLKLMFRPSGGAPAGNLPSTGSFYYIASAPETLPDRIGAELESLAERGILQKLEETCAWDSPVDIRYRQADGYEEIMTSVLPIQSRWGCWVLVSAHPTSEFLNISIGRSYWQTREIRIAAAIYFAFALLAILIALSVWRSLHHFRRVAREIRQGRAMEDTFTDRNIVPELTSVASDIDHLVHDLRKVAQDIRQTAEDNAHSFKGPLGTIQASLDPIRRALPGENERASRAVELIESSIAKLNILVNAAQRLDHTVADLIDAPRPRIDLTRVVADILLRYRDIMSERQVRLVRALEEEAIVRAGRGVIDIAFENVLENAVSFSPAGASIAVYLFRERDMIHLHVDDEGPGIEPEIIEHIFERYFSLRQKPQPLLPGGGESAGNAGLGLWIARRNIEAVGGSIEVVSRIGGGLSVRMTLPAA